MAVLHPCGGPCWLLPQGAYFDGCGGCSALHFDVGLVFPLSGFLAQLGLVGYLAAVGSDRPHLWAPTAHIGQSAHKSRLFLKTVRAPVGPVLGSVQLLNQPNIIMTRLTSSRGQLHLHVHCRNCFD